MSFDYKRIAKQMEKDAAHKAKKDMNTTKDLIIKALSNTDPFLEHDGELYKMFDNIKIEAHYEYRDKKVGLFKTEPEPFYCGVLVSFYYQDTVVFKRVVGDPMFSFENGDMLNLCEFGGVIKTNVDAP